MTVSGTEDRVFKYKKMIITNRSGRGAGITSLYSTKDYDNEFTYLLVAEINHSQPQS